MGRPRDLLRPHRVRRDWEGRRWRQWATCGPGARGPARRPLPQARTATSDSRGCVRRRTLTPTARTWRRSPLLSLPASTAPTHATVARRPWERHCDVVSLMQGSRVLGSVVAPRTWSGPTGGGLGYSRIQCESHAEIARTDDSTAGIGNCRFCRFRRYPASDARSPASIFCLATADYGTRPRASFVLAAVDQLRDFALGQRALAK